MAAARTQRAKGVCSAYNLPEEDDEPECPYIFFAATEVQSKTGPATAPRQKNGTWPFGPLTAVRPWPFVEREKPAISLGGQDEPDLSYMYGGTDDEVEPPYGNALMSSAPAAFKHMPRAGDDSVAVLVDSGASGHYFDDLIIPSLKHRLLNYILLTTPRKVSHCRRCLAGRPGRRDTSRPRHRQSRGTTSCVDCYPHCVWLRAQLSSVKSTTKKGASFPFSTSTTPGWSYPASPSHFVQKMTASTLWCLT